MPSVQLLLEKDTDIRNLCASDINQEVYDKLRFYTDDQDLLFASLIYNPFGKTDLAALKGTVDKPVKQILATMNRFQEMEEEVFQIFNKIKKIAVLYLLNCETILNRSTKNRIESRWMNKKRAVYSAKMLEKVNIGSIKTTLEDRFFAVTEPEIYSNYCSLLKYTKKQYLISQKKYLEHFKKLMEDNHIDAEIQSRLKSIYSIHKKIIKKNILFSQVLDTIGLRVITNSTEDCYRAMGVILNNFPSLTGRIKDYIAIPKENGYRSIHLTIIHKGHPTEIQIRTWAMHEQAQFGKANHTVYKTVLN
jgi:(p)ppGpp synthase/HD superfamily hydrolase